MEGRPNYSLFHLQELKEALANIDENANPEEAKIIREHIERGGHAYPKPPDVAGIRFTNMAYKWSITAILTALFLSNTYALVFGGGMRALIPMALQGAALLLIFTNHRHTQLLIKIWSGLLVVSGIFGLSARLFDSDIQWLEVVWPLLKLFLGLVIFNLSNKYVEPVVVSPAGHVQP